MKTTFLNRAMVERRASEALRAYQLQMERPLSLPIDAELVGSIVFKLSWDWDHLDEPPGQRVLAALFVGDARAVLNERHKSLFDEKPGLDQYTRAHEVGHAALHTQPGELGSGAGGQILHRDTSGMANHAEMFWKERQADWYAAYLLMPEDRFIPEVRRQFPQTAVEAGHMATKLFGVTYTAFNKRLKTLGFPYFDHGGCYCAPADSHPDQLSLF